VLEYLKKTAVGGLYYACSSKHILNWCIGANEFLIFHEKIGLVAIEPSAASKGKQFSL
jgi:hypothetical protein